MSDTLTLQVTEKSVHLTHQDSPQVVIRGSRDDIVRLVVGETVRVVHADESVVVPEPTTRQVTLVHRDQLKVINSGSLGPRGPQGPPGELDDRSVILEYTLGGDLETVLREDGAISSLTFDANGDLVGVSHTDRPDRTLTYYPNGDLHTVDVA